MPGAVRHHRLSPWGRVVAVSVVLVYGIALALLAGNIATRRERVAEYRVRGQLTGVSLDLGDGDVQIVSGGARPVLSVRRTARSAYGRTPATARSVTAGVLRLRSRCPETVLRSCRVRYRLAVPDNVPVDVTTTDGDVAFRDYIGSARVTTRSGSIDVSGFCGFSLTATAQSGHIAAATSCATPQLALRSTSGDVSATVPRGRYRVEAASASGSRSVRRIDAVRDAPFSVQALSTSGDVAVSGAAPGAQERR